MNVADSSISAKVATKLGSGEDSAMASDPFSELPTEDAGAATAHRFHFQYCCAASRLLAALAADLDCELICEWHEDYLVVNENGTEAVSVKHREDHRPRWSVPTLVSDGGLGHLMDSFSRADGLECCFESNRSHEAALWATEADSRNAARDDLTERLAATRTEIDEFLAHLTLTNPPVPSRHHIDATYAQRHAAPALDRLGMSALSASEAVRIACTLVANASQDRIAEEAWIAILTAAADSRVAELAKHRLEARRVTTDDLREAFARANLESVPSLEHASEEPPPESTMTRKLERGGLGPSVVETAKRRRHSWYSHEAQVRDIPEREGELRSVLEWVQDQANLAEGEARGPWGDQSDDGYGVNMYRELMRRLQADRCPPGTRGEDRNPALLSGAAFELTDRCTVWWSAKFEEDEAGNVA